MSKYKNTKNFQDNILYIDKKIKKSSYENVIYFFLYFYIIRQILDLKCRFSLNLPIQKNVLVCIFSMIFVLKNEK